MPMVARRCEHRPAGGENAVLPLCRLFGFASEAEAPRAVDVQLVLGLISPFFSQARLAWACCTLSNCKVL